MRSVPGLRRPQRLEAMAQERAGKQFLRATLVVRR